MQPNDVYDEIAGALIKTDYEQLGLSRASDYRTLVPVVDYDALSERVELQKVHEQQSIVSERVLS